MSFNKEGLSLTQIIRKGNTRTSLLKRNYIRNPKVGLTPKIVTLVTISKVTKFITGTYNYFGHRHPTHSRLGKGHTHYSKFNGKETSYPKIIKVWVPNVLMFSELGTGLVHPNLTTKECKKV